MTVLSRIGRHFTSLPTKIFPGTNIGLFGSLVIEGHYLQRNISAGTRLLAASLPHVRPTSISKDDKRDFMAVFPDIVRELTQNKKEKFPDIGTILGKIMQYNVSGGKNVRGLTTVYAYRMLAPEEDLTPENIRMVQVVGWCLEMLQGFFVIADDLTDGSLTRRQRPCWYKLPDVGLRAVSDALVLQAEALYLYEKHCKDKSFYVPVLELLLKAIRKTAYGQVLDSITSYSKLDSLTMDRYNFIIRHKTSYYTFYLPVAIGMFMAGIHTKELHRQSESVLLEIGNYFQVQDDYLDVFGDEEITGKKGTDIQEGKCTWLAIIAFQRATPEQRLILEHCYGKKDEDKIKTVKDTFLEIGLPGIYNAYEEETFNLINRQIQQLSAGLPHELYLTLLHKIYGRNK